MKFKTYASDLSVDFIDHPLHIHKIENLRTYEFVNYDTKGLVQAFK